MGSVSFRVGVGGDGSSVIITSPVGEVLGVLRTGDVGKARVGTGVRVAFSSAGAVVGGGSKPNEVRQDPSTPVVSML